jgi:hypothetical protein
MAFQLLIRAALGPAFAAGEISLMSTAAGATTTLVGTSGTIVGTATLVPAASATAGGATVVAGGGGAAGATAVAAASTLVLPIALAVGGALLIGGGCYLLYRSRRSREQADDPVVLNVPEGVDMEAALREAQEIVDREYRRLTDGGPRPLVGLREVDPSEGAAS